ncbi:MAG: GDSL-type esterase/lipase family protein, partial [Pseudomonadota bacterium]
ISNVVDLINTSLSKMSERRIDAFEASKIDAVDVVFLGDSITHEGMWSEYFPGVTVLNRGIGGDTTEDLLERFEGVAALKPAKLFLMIGVNDLNNGGAPDEIIPRYRDLFDRFDREIPETAIYVQSVLPTNDQWVLPASLKDVRALNDYLKTEAAARQYQYLDVAALFADADGTLRKDLSNDGIHLSGDAYPIWRDFVSPYVEEAL